MDKGCSVLKPPILPVTIAPHGTERASIYEQARHGGAGGGLATASILMSIVAATRDTRFSSGSGNIPFRYKKTCRKAVTPVAGWRTSSIVK